MNISAGRSTYIIWFSILSDPVLIILSALLVRGFVFSVVPVFCCWGGMLSFVFFWISRFNLRADGEYICYGSLFSGEICIHFADIIIVKHRSGMYRYTDRFLPPLRLEIKGKRNQVIMVNLKVFSKEDVYSLIEWFSIRGFNNI
ncbi:hypothetical protein EK72_002654 [Salmonella enterica subsp. enterica]|nr:hypothetical protein [Salmonella enterica subsp. enterica]